MRTAEHALLPGRVICLGTKITNVDDRAQFENYLDSLSAANAKLTTDLHGLNTGSDF